MGLDIGKIASGACMIRNLKEIPGGRPNPAANCDIKGGDIIIGINGQRVADFQAVVAVIRGLGNGAVQLTLERSL
jgi:C-terminal processing protease CtpA/Prc